MGLLHLLEVNFKDVEFLTGGDVEERFMLLSVLVLMLIDAITNNYLFNFG